MTNFKIYLLPTDSAELSINAGWLSMDISHPEGTSSHPNSFNAALMSSVCFSIFRSWHFNSLTSFLDDSTLIDNLKIKCNFVILVNLLD